MDKRAALLTHDDHGAGNRIAERPAGRERVREIDGKVLDSAVNLAMTRVNRLSLISAG